MYHTLKSMIVIIITYNLCYISRILYSKGLFTARRPNMDFFQIIYPNETQSAGKAKTLEEMLKQLKMYWLEKTVYTRVLTEPVFNAASRPPVIAPSVQADVFINTEAEKKSNYLPKEPEGDYNLV